MLGIVKDNYVISAQKVSHLDCSMGHTKVCTVAIDDGHSRLTRICPKVVSMQKSHDEQEQMCTCLPTLLVEQALADGISPLGMNFKSCVFISYNIVFPVVNGNCIFRKNFYSLIETHDRTHAR